MCMEDIRIGQQSNYSVTNPSVTSAAVATANLILPRRANRTHVRISLDNGNCWIRLRGAVGGIDVAYIFGTFNQKEWDITVDGSIVTEEFYAWSPTPPMTIYVTETWLEKPQ